MEAQAKEIESHIEAISILENQKLDIVQGKILIFICLSIKNYRSNFVLT